MAAEERRNDKELLLGMKLPLESWRADVLLADFEGVTIGEDGSITSLDFSIFQNKSDIEFDLSNFAPLVLKEVNFEACRRCTGWCARVCGGAWLS